MITRQHATVLINLIDVATQSDWPDVVRGVAALGYSPQETRSAWLALEADAGMQGTVPSMSDFEDALGGESEGGD